MASTALLPLEAVFEAFRELREEGVEVWRWWSQLHSRALAEKAAEHLPKTPRGGRVDARSAPFSTLAKIQATAGLKALRELASTRKPAHGLGNAAAGRTAARKKRRKAEAARPRAKQSAGLFRWLFRCCLAWLCYERVRVRPAAAAAAAGRGRIQKSCIATSAAAAAADLGVLAATLPQDSWSAAVQLALLAVTAAAVVGVPVMLLWKARQAAVTANTPGKASPSPAHRQSSARSGRVASAALSMLTPIRRLFLSGDEPPAAGLAAASGALNGTAGGDSEAEDAAAAHAAAAPAAWRRWLGVAGVAWGRGQAGFRGLLLANLNVLVSAGLVLGLVVGGSALGALLTARVANEGREAVMGLRNAAWAGGANGTAPLPTAVPLPGWLSGYQQQAAKLAQQALPSVSSWLEAKVHSLAAAQNLTAALGDVRLLYEAVQGPRRCGDEERGGLTVAVAAADLAADAAARRREAVQAEVRRPAGSDTSLSWGTRPLQAGSAAV